jgi:hypothetical protein
MKRSGIRETRRKDGNCSRSSRHSEHSEPCNGKNRRIIYLHGKIFASSSEESPATKCELCPGRSLAATIEVIILSVHSPLAVAITESLLLGMTRREQLQKIKRVQD